MGAAGILCILSILVERCCRPEPTPPKQPLSCYVASYFTEQHRLRRPDRAWIYFAPPIIPCILMMGRKIARTMPPTTTPMIPIMSGSMSEVMDSTVAATCSS